MDSKPRRGRPANKAAEALTETILDVATELFLEQGYAATSLEVIAASARVGKHTLYRRFPDKAALFIATMARGLPDVEAVAKAHDDLPPLERLKALATTVLDATITSQVIRFVRVVIAEGTRFPELAERFREHGGRRSVAAAKALILEAQAAGALRADDPDWLSRNFISLTVGLPFNHHLLGGREYDDPAVRARHLDQAWRLFMDGAGTPEQAG